MNPLITADELAALPGPRVLDVRWKLGGPPGPEEFRAGHLPGAVYVDLDAELAAPASAQDGRHPLPDPAAFATAARSWGLNDGDTVVAYDDNGLLSAARVWWLLRWAGFQGEVKLLDGGLRAWTEAGRPLVTGDEPAPAAGTATLGEGHLPTVGPDDVTAFVKAGGLLLDARPAERYRGEVASVDPVPGHIAGAVSAPALANLGGDGRFAPAAELAERFRGLGADGSGELGVYCGSGVTATHDLVALEVAGIDTARVALYPGSYSQWANLPGAAIATGNEPG
ncbi:sulfurtransferase [Kineosporia sp. J2-2]|uniref:Sulfurtransferase n=1 Tax=Kineosporia corallincola TaxID=2835133 RepID=A0ABS5TM59_9ACTN|nr:sulfurtransferase [Kineosporia corallincola]MBT0772190.1 sulfurtransferase [Kineosporia corallincola]